MGGEATADPTPPIFLLQPRQYPTAGTEIQSISQITDLIPIPFTGLFAAGDEPIFHGDVVQTFSKSRTRTRSHKSYVANYKTSHCEFIHTESGNRQSYVTTRTSKYYRVLGSAIIYPYLIQHQPTREFFSLGSDFQPFEAYATYLPDENGNYQPIPDKNSLPGKPSEPKPAPDRPVSLGLISNGAGTCKICGEPITHVWNDHLQKGFWIHSPEAFPMRATHTHFAEPSLTVKIYEFQNPKPE